MEHYTCTSHALMYILCPTIIVGSARDEHTGAEFHATKGSFSSIYVWKTIDFFCSKKNPILQSNIDRKAQIRENKISQGRTITTTARIAKKDKLFIQNQIILRLCSRNLSFSHFHTGLLWQCTVWRYTESYIDGENPYEAPTTTFMII